jgi:DNA repair protein RadC
LYWCLPSLGTSVAAWAPQPAPTAGDDRVRPEDPRVVRLKTRNEVPRVVTVYRGSVNAAQVRVAEVFKEAVRLNAPALVAVHNHPSVAPRGA